MNETNVIKLDELEKSYRQGDCTKSTLEEMVGFLIRDLKDAYNEIQIFRKDKILLTKEILHLQRLHQEDIKEIMNLREQIALLKGESTFPIYLRRREE